MLAIKWLCVFLENLHTLCCVKSVLIVFALCYAGVRLLATASRDRLVHIFDIDHDYGLVQTLDDHSSAITAVRFTQLDSQLMMLSCGADKSLLFRNAQLVCYIFLFFFCIHWICPVCIND